MAPKRVQLSLSEKNAIAALHKAGLKGPAIARETGHSLPTIYVVLKRFKQRGTVENKERSG
jgi:IS30 family transposase